jgi:hypothetical protein
VVNKIASAAQSEPAKPQESKTEMLNAVLDALPEPEAKPKKPRRASSILAKARGKK